MPLSSHDHHPPNGLKTKVLSWFWSLTPTCKEIARLTSEGRDHPLPLGRRLRLSLHRTFCQSCARYAEQLDLMHEAIHHFPEHVDEIDEPSLNGHAIARMKRAIQEVMEERLILIGGLFLSLTARSLVYAV